MRTSLLLSSFVLVAACAPKAPPAPAPIPPQVAGAPARDFTLEDIDGKPVQLGPHLGKDVVLLNFWESWCAPCIAEMPHLRQLAEQKRDRGLVVLVITMDSAETVANAQAFVRRSELNFDVLVDANARVASVYNPKRAAPLTVVIDRRGTITSVHEGYAPGDEIALNEAVEKALAAQ